MSTKQNQSEEKYSTITADLQDFFVWQEKATAILEEEKGRKTSAINEKYHDAVEANQVANDEIFRIMVEFLIDWGYEMEDFAQEVNAVAEEYAKLIELTGKPSSFYASLKDKSTFLHLSIAHGGDLNA